ncbi:MAG: DUF3488 and transglutaminase-like domain-containing protein [Phycisphaerales bacterium]|jgi:transglutaminase-like putative cysteine protease|nr:DUF3488 and transglutaminase-like domain-containing protein [Phycisphaerales bacterium]
MMGSRAFLISAFITIELAILAYAVAAGNVAMALLAAPIVALGWWLTEGPAKLRLPKVVTSLGVAGVVLWGILRALQGGVDVDGFCIFIVLVQLLKVFEPKKPRDHAQLLTLSAFLGVGAVLTSNMLGFAALLLLLVPSLAISAMLFQIHAVRERAVEGGSGSVRLAIGRTPLAHLRGTVGAALLLSFMISVALFVFMPRGLGTQVFGAWGNALAGRVVGFSDRVELGRGGSISQSEATVLDLRVRDTQGNSLSGGGRTWYLRGAVLSDYDPDRGTWTAAREDQPRPVRLSFSLAGGLAGHAIRSSIPQDATRIVQEITLRGAPPGQTYLFAIYDPAFIETAHVMTLFRSNAEGTLRAETGGGQISYTITSVPDEPTRPRKPSPREKQSLSPAIASFAEDVLRDADLEPDPALRPLEDDLPAARLLAAHLRRNLSYTLDLTAPPPGREPIEWFLFEERRGHCEYFASAHVALCRAVGIPSRVVTGFLASEYSTSTDHYDVRESDAHAWSEVESSPGLWVTLDATPEGTLRAAQPRPTGLLARARQLIAAIDYAWVRGVVGFDEHDRSQLLGTEPVRDADIAARLQGVARRMQVGGTPLILRAALTGALVGVATIGVGLALLALWRIVRLPAIARRGLFAPRDPVERLARDLARVLSRRGVPRTPWEPLQHHASRVSWPDADAARAHARLVDLLYAARFAGSPPGPASLEEARRDLATLRSAAGQPTLGPDAPALVA